MFGHVTAAAKLSSGGRKHVLGCEAIIDADHDATRPVGERATNAVVTFEIADHPSAAVEINQHRKGTFMREWGV